MYREAEERLDNKYVDGRVKSWNEVYTRGILEEVKVLLATRKNDSCKVREPQFPVTRVHVPRLTGRDLSAG